MSLQRGVVALDCEMLYLGQRVTDALAVNSGCKAPTDHDTLEDPDHTLTPISQLKVIVFKDPLVESLLAERQGSFRVVV